jgi:acetyltransferase
MDGPAHLPAHLPARPAVPGTRPTGIGPAWPLIRPIRPDDGPALAAHVRTLSPGSRRSRYLGGVNDLSAGEIRRIVTGDGGRLRALVAEVEGPDGPVVIGEALVARGCDAITAEFALSVADDWRRRGLGTRLIGHIAWLAVGFGASRLAGETLRDNAAMTALAEAGGFAVRSHPGDARLLLIGRPVMVPALIGGLRSEGLCTALAA